MSLPATTVVIVTWNSAAVVGACLRSLVEHPPEGEWDVVIVDNGSTDGTLAEVRAVLPAGRVIANRANRGLPAANNQGICVTASETLLICNPDVEFAPGAVDELRRALVRHPQAAWVVPRLRHPDGRLQASAGDLPSLADALLGRQAARLRSRSAPRADAGMWWDAWDHADEREIGRGHEAAYLVRRRAVDEVGLQDERYRLDWEGMDWTDRFRRAGWQIWLCPSAEVVHHGGASIRQVPVRWVASQHVGMFLYFADRRPGWARPLLAGGFALRAGLKLLGLAAGPTRYRRSHGGRASQEETRP